MTGSNQLDFANGASARKPSGVIVFSDPDPADRPTGSIKSQTATYTDAHGNAFVLSPTQIAAFEGAFSIKAEAGNTNTGVVN